MMSEPLRHGIFVAPFHPVRENPTLALERDLEVCEWVDQLGFHEAWIGEHHSGGMEIIDSPELMIAAAAARTKHIMLGTGVISVPYHHPLNVANRIVQLDHMTRGRVMFGAGPGLLASDALMMGIEPADTRARLDEGLGVVIRLLRGEVVTEVSEWYTLREARTHLRPYTFPHPEICVASAVTPSGSRVAGKYGLGMLAVAAGEKAGYDNLGTNWNVACEVANNNGQIMDPKRLRCVLNIHLADSRDQAFRDIQYGTREYIDYFAASRPGGTIPEGTDYVDWAIESDIVTIGTPAAAIERIERLYDRVDDFGGVLLQVNCMANWTATKRSLELYANHVIPHFSGANAARLASADWVRANKPEFATKRAAAVEKAMKPQAGDRQSESPA